MKVLTEVPSDQDPFWWALSQAEKCLDEGDEEKAEEWLKWAKACADDLNFINQKQTS